MLRLSPTTRSRRHIKSKSYKRIINTLKRQNKKNVEIIASQREKIEHLKNQSIKQRQRETIVEENQILKETVVFLQHQNKNLRTPKNGMDWTFDCRICNRQFKTNVTLSRHMRTHSNEKPFQCKNCNKRLARSDYLRNHIRIHTGEKPFQCTKCLRQFSRKSNLNRHCKNKSCTK
eukprot:UN09774